MGLKESLQLIEDMKAAPALKEDGVAGRGPELGVVLVSDKVKSLNYFLNMPFVKLANKKRRDTLMHEFVWDPINIQFATIVYGIRLHGSPHQTLARAIGADEQFVCGGTIRYPTEQAAPRSLGVIARLCTDEFSGHFGERWTDPVRLQYKKYMNLRTGLVIDHAVWSTPSSPEATNK